MKDWYEEYIEEPVRKTVRLLRDNGFNTVCSCGHKMYIQCSYITDGEIMRLDNLLFNNGHRDYKIDLSVHRKEGHIYSSIDITFPPMTDEKGEEKTNE